MVDQRIGRFRLERALGSGAFSTVWLAHDEELDDAVALKILADNWSQSDDARRRFVEEARALRRLDGDRIVRVYELAHLAGGRPYMVMELADRGSLEERMRFAKQVDRPFSASEVAALGIELAGCLASVHAGRFVHRDVKPSNILFRTVPPEAQDALRRTGRPAPTERMLLGDFGIARRMEMAGLTQVVGSPQYMAPEQGDPDRAHRVDARADIYSAGMVLFELLAGSPPRMGNGTGVIELEGVANDPFGSSRAANGTPPDVREHRSDVPATLAEALKRAVAREPGARYDSAWELRQDLVRSLGEPASAGISGLRSAEHGPVIRLDPVGMAPVGTRPARDQRPAMGTTGVMARPTGTDVLRDGSSPLPPRPGPSTSRSGFAMVPGRAAPAPATSRELPHPTHPAPAGPSSRLGVLDTCVWTALAGITLVIAALLPWRSAGGPAQVAGIATRPGTIAFAAAGALVLAAVLRWATRGRWGLRLARTLADLGGLAALAAVVAEIVTSRGALHAIFLHGIHAGLGLGVPVTLAGGILSFVAAGRAKRQLRAHRFWLMGGRAGSGDPTYAAAAGP
jgi:serine/threonine protein kinase